tara:strand:- start:50 stop:427 length:378 start_codon:yes stop_codon:yes gene_type:complete
MNVPANLMYTKDHEWLEINDDSIKVGISDFAQSQLGDIIFIDLPNIGDQLVAGEPFGEVEAVKTVSELYSPVTGIVLSINESVLDNPEQINDSPYSSGWLIIISKPESPKFVELFTFDSYKKIIS